MFDPIHAAEEIKSSYIDYITTTFDMADRDYAEQLRLALSQEGMVAKGPYLDIGGAFQSGHTLRELVEAGSASPLFEKLEPVPERERELKLERPLYLHQEQALLKASKGENLVVTTGTGSGKTESFLLPILQHILTQEEEGVLDSGVRAIIIYPMNALANDQLKRMRALLKNYPKIRFGVYNGNTPHQYREALGDYKKTHKNEQGQPLDPLPNELISREEMQSEPPHILITNYSMLEYMMLRPKDDRVFSGAKLRYIVLDEAHIYKGATGMETSLLMRRLRARISKPDSVQYILTSATLGGPEADGEILRFANKLTGVDFRENGIIRSAEKRPDMLETLDVDPSLFSELCRSPGNVTAILQKKGLDFCSEGTPEEKLYDLFLRLKLFSTLRQTASAPVTVTQLHKSLAQTAPAITREQVVEFITVCARAERDGASLIKPRYHFFVRALEGAYITLDAPKSLFLQRRNTVNRPGELPQAVFEAAICDDCGRMAVAGKTEDGKLLQYARQGRKDDTEYYLLRDDTDGELFEDEETELDDRKEDDGSHDFALCPTCGAITTEADLRYQVPCEHEASNYVKVRLVDQTPSGRTKCPACGFGSLRRFYLGSEAATAVLGTELFEQLPSEEVTEVVEEPKAATGLFARAAKKKVLRKERARQFLCFSDSRSEAAFFATYMERSYQEFLRRRGIWHTAEKLKERGEIRITVRDFVNELSRYFEENRCFAEWDDQTRSAGGLTSVSRQNAWVAILNEMFNARRATSLATLGLISFAFQRNEGLADPVAERYGISQQEAGALLEQLAMDAVFSGALNAGKEQKLTDAEREYIFFSPYEKRLVKVKTAENSKKGSISGWCGRTRSNGNYYPNTRIARLVRALNITEKEADDFLSDYWDGVFQPESEQFALDATEFDILLGGTDAVQFYRCKKCGKVTAHNVGGFCSSVKCDGQLEEYEPLQSAKKNHYARLYMSEQMHPLYIKEHTAQLAKDQQTRYQEAFVNKSINALSCSTTFEMGVDVGSLETVYLRDVPPSPSNYVQRAGRAGRGKGSAAFVMTYAKLSSHDFTYYEEPERMISGTIRAPVFEVENEKILYRHIYAVAISAFLAQNPEEYDGDNQTVLLNEGGYERLQGYLADRPEELRGLLRRSIPRSMHQRLGIEDWNWVEHLCGENGVLQLAVDDFRGMVAELEKEQKNAHKNHDDELAGKWQRSLRYFRCAKEDDAGKKSLISFLVRNNVLPKYGFPVDTVELLPNVGGSRRERDLQLARDLQMAIADYAPGAQVVADGKLYTSRYIRKMPGRNSSAAWEIGSYCPKCPTCGQPNFTKEPVTKSRECVSCHQLIPKMRWHKTLEPRMGFCADVTKRDEPVPMHKPEHDYKTEDHYIGDPQRNILLEQEFSVNGGTVRIASTTNDSLVVVGQTKFHVCQACGYAKEEGIPLEHKNMRGYPCVNKEGAGKEYLLSHDFKTDVARITFVDQASGDQITMISVLYALLEGLSREMGIERTDIKGTLFRTYEDGILLYSVILYDAVAGGAGHVRRLVTEDGAAFQRVLKRSFQAVSSCDCGSSCYKCLRNYYNQKIHDSLDRYKAAAFLQTWIGDMKPSEQCTEESEEEIADAADSVEITLPDDFGMNMGDSSWAIIWDEVATAAEGDAELALIQRLKNSEDLFHGKEKPFLDCQFYAGEEYDCDLLWPRSGVMFFTEENRIGYEAALQGSWTCFLASDETTSPETIAAALKEE